MTRVRTHPGKVLRAELEARGMSARRLALASRVAALLRGDRPITAETALRLGCYLGTGPAFWINLQTAHDLSAVESEKGKAIEREVAAAS